MYLSIKRYRVYFQFTCVHLSVLAMLTSYTSCGCFLMFPQVLADLGKATLLFHALWSWVTGRLKLDTFRHSNSSTGKLRALLGMW